MESVFKLSVVMGMIDGLSSPLSGVTDNVTGAAKKLNDAFGTVQKAGTALAGAGTGITSACLATVTSTFDTQDALGELSSLGVEDLKAVENAAKNFSDTWAGTTKADFITASYDIKSGIASLSDEGIAQFTELAALTGKATKSTTEEMGSLFATGYGIYKGAYDDLSDLEFGEMFSAGISTAVKNYKTAGSEMASAISALGATATNNKISMEEQLAILGQLQTTMSGSEAATKYKAFLNAAASAGKNLKLSFVDANNQLLSTPEILEKLKGKYGETIDAVEKQEIKKAFGTDEAVAMIDLLYNDIDGLKGGIDSLGKSMKKGKGVTQEMAEAINNTPAQKFEVIKQQIHNNTEELGSKLLPTVNKTLDKVSSLIQKGSDWISNNQKTVQTIMDIALKLGIVLIVLGTVITVIGTFGRAVTIAKGAWSVLVKAFTASPTGIVVAGIIALITAFIVLWNKSEAFRNFWIDLFGKVKGVLQDACGAIIPTVKKLGKNILSLYDTAFVPLWNKMQPFVSYFVELFTEIVQAVQSAWSILQPVLQKLGQDIIKSAQSAWSTLQPVLQKLGQNIIKFCEAIKPIAKVLAEIGGIVATVFLGVFVGAIHGVLVALTPLINAFSSLVSFVTNVINAIVALFTGDFSGACGFLKLAVDDIKGAFISGFNAVLSFISGFVSGFLNTVNSVLNAFGIDIPGAVSKMKNAVSNGLNAVKRFFSNAMGAAVAIVRGKLTAIKNGFQSILNGAKNIVSNILGAIKGIFGSIMGAAVATVKTKLNNIKNAYQQNGGGIKGIVAAAIAAVKGFFTAGLTFIDNLTNGKLTAIKNKFQSILEGAKNIVKGAIDKIKGFFNFSWSLPSIKLPHFSISGKFSLKPPSIPKIGVDWYAKGGVMTSPTIFGASGDKLLGGGEAGDEAILPLSALWEKLKLFIHNELDDNESPRYTGKNIVSALSRRVTRTIESKETKTTRQEVKELKTRNRNRKTVIQKIEIKVDIEKIKDLPLLFKLVDELKDAQESTDTGGTEMA